MPSPQSDVLADTGMEKEMGLRIVHDSPLWPNRDQYDVQWNGCCSQVEAGGVGGVCREISRNESVQGKTETLPCEC